MPEIPPLPPDAEIIPHEQEPPPGLPTAPLADTSSLKVGDVIQIAVLKEDRIRGGSYWWKRFAVVTRLYHRSFDALNLKLNPKIEPFERGSDMNLNMNFATSPWNEPQVITKLQEPYPQGVAAMYMKLLALRIINLEGGD